MANRFLSTASLAALVGSCLLSSACAPLLVGGAIAGGAVVATDRRSVGMQVEDEAIERRFSRALNDRFGNDTAIHVSSTSYNRKLLLVGEAPTAEISSEIEAIAGRVDNVRAVVNEIYVGRVSTTGNRLNDTALSTKVRAALIDAADVPSGAVTVNVERGVAYLMGRVTEAEGTSAARAASRADGLLRVVKVFDYITEEERRALATQSQPPQSPRKP
jgi:osmotically-inducible protein OsmY